MFGGSSIFGDSGGRNNIGRGSSNSEGFEVSILFIEVDMQLTYIYNIYIVQLAVGQYDVW